MNKMRARDTTKSKKYPKYLGEFVSDLQIDLARSLTKSGSCTKKGKFIILSKIQFNKFELIQPNLTRVKVKEKTAPRKD